MDHFIAEHAPELHLEGEVPEAPVADPPEAPEPEYGYGEDVGVPVEARRQEVREALECIRDIRRATLDNSGLDSETVDRLHNPPRAVPELTDFERAGMRMFLARGDGSQDNYEDNRAAIIELHNADDIPSYDQIKRRIASVTGISTIRTAMCINSCVVFTGPFAELADCPTCREPRYDPWHLARGDQVPRRTFETFPVGPQIQAMYASPENARLMRHRAQRTQEIRDAAMADPAAHPDIDDVYSGKDYLREVKEGRIKDDDVVLMFSLDGAQLYTNKSSDCWFFIWVLYDLPPDARYKKHYVLPGGVIGGPNKPKNVDSFLIPALSHLSALQNDGLQIWDAQQRQFRSDPYLLLATADGPGMAYLNGMVGHQGARGCRLYCGFRGRLKPTANTYYPAAAKPHDYDQEGSSHPNVSLRTRAGTSAEICAEYAQNVREVIVTGGRANYQRVRLETGIAKPSIFTGLRRTLPLPTGFGADLMHLITLNLTDLIISLLRGSLVCEPTDDLETWDWAVFADKPTWKAHGKLVADCTRYLPGSFDRPPRNPAEKISSGYKAWEYLLYVYGLLPGLLRPLQSPLYYKSFCRFVSGIRIVLQRRIPAAQLRMAHVRLVEHAEEFEVLYYQRRVDRLHFVRQSIHATTHLATEADRLGPGALYSQWTLENYIGNVTREMKQHVTPYANVSERARRRCLIIALRAMYPMFAADDSHPATSRNLGDGYWLLHARARTPSTVAGQEREALVAYLAARAVHVDDAATLRGTRWARLELPNGQIARTAWKEEALEMRGKKPRRSRMVKASLADGRIAEVRYFFEGAAHGDTFALAMLSVFSAPDADLYRETFGVLWACNYAGDTSRVVVDAKDIVSVVAMVPLPCTPAEADEPDAAQKYEERYFLVEKPGLDIAFLGGYAQDWEGDDDDADI
ncbi:hypothetical protein VTO73DRAFT_13804 [Trametes versicolor]